MRGVEVEVGSVMREGEERGRKKSRKEGKGGVPCFIGSASYASPPLPAGRKALTWMASVTNPPHLTFP